MKPSKIKKQSALKSKFITCTVPVHLGLLKKQAKTLLKIINRDSTTPKEKEDLEGVWNMCHFILDHEGK